MFQRTTLLVLTFALLLGGVGAAQQSQQGRTTSLVATPPPPPKPIPIVVRTTPIQRCWVKYPYSKLAPYYCVCTEWLRPKSCARYSYRFFSNSLTPAYVSAQTPTITLHLVLHLPGSGVFHRFGCHHLKYSKNKPLILLKEEALGMMLRPCKDCNP